MAGRRVALAASTLLTIAVVLVFTVGKAFFSVPGLWDMEAHQVRQLRLIPFETFVYYRVWWGPWLNLFGNIALFLPVGAVVYWGAAARGGGASRAPRGGSARELVRRATLAGLAFSVCIEIAQFILAAGYSDLDDVIFNTIGAYLGARLAAHLAARSAAQSAARSAAG